MKVTVEEHRRLMAVVAEHRQGFFIRAYGETERCWYVGTTTTPLVNKSLEEILEQSPQRKGVYEGDVITLTL